MPLLYEPYDIITRTDDQFWYVYELFYEFATFYVGMTNNPRKRLYEHLSGEKLKCLAEAAGPFQMRIVSRHGSAEAAHSAEKALIARYGKRILNRAFVEGRTLPPTIEQRSILGL